MLDENPYQDALGDMYMRLGIGNEAGGQFFTPFHVSKLFARINLSKATQTLAEQGYITISEPSCGAGANVIACCAAMADMGIDWQRQAVFEQERRFPPPLYRPAGRCSVSYRYA